MIIFKTNKAYLCDLVIYKFTKKDSEIVIFI